MNANLIVNSKIYEKEVLPQGAEKFFFTLHPGFYNKYVNDNKEINSIIRPFIEYANINDKHIKPKYLN